MVGEKDLRIDRLHGFDITPSSDLWDERIIDILEQVDYNKETLLDFLRDLCELLDLPDGILVEPESPERFFDIYSEYYESDLIEVNLALAQSGFFTHSILADISLSQLLSISGICADNVKLFLEKIQIAHLNEYGY